MKTQYATMVGNICLDKSPWVDGTDKGRPIQFKVKKIRHGSPAWAGFNDFNSGNKTLQGAIPALEMAVRELFSAFEHVMDTQGYELRVEGEPYYQPKNDGTDEFEQSPYGGESGWYDLNNNCTLDLDNPANNKADYPLSDYPPTWQEWKEKQIHSFTYDVYAYCILTENDDVVY